MLDSLIKTIFDQHREIQNYLKKINQEVGDNHKVIDDLFSLKKLLVEHTKLEEEKLYPDFLKMVDDKLNETEAETYHKVVDQMEDVLKRVNYFFSLYEDENSVADIQKFQKNFKDLEMALEIRISVEELTIYTEWEKLKRM